MKITKSKLRELKKDYDFLNDYEGMKKFVIRIALESEYDNIQGWFENLFRHGCQSGMISELLYYKDTYKFFDKYSEEIFTLLDEIQEEFGEVEVKGARKNFYAWLGFEEIARKIYDYFECE